MCINRIAVYKMTTLNNSIFTLNCFSLALRFHNFNKVHIMRYKTKVSVKTFFLFQVLWGHKKG